MLLLTECSLGNSCSSVHQDCNFILLFWLSLTLSPHRASGLLHLFLSHLAVRFHRLLANYCIVFNIVLEHTEQWFWSTQIAPQSDQAESTPLAGAENYQSLRVSPLSPEEDLCTVVQTWGDEREFCPLLAASHRSPLCSKNYVKWEAKYRRGTGAVTQLLPNCPAWPEKMEWANVSWLLSHPGIGLLP